ncbi:unnamed protein product [Phytophthora fragariaefolia]|uniref:Unnamed protein product n=1 Tax=Phytophthora fragariaefolia TaxID=1490495 RepID=A0A9W6YH83_9STRA|nr:unnamed protein product [Phytophthora fragariaefolia]
MEPDLPAGKTSWESSDASLAYCFKCRETFPFKAGTSANIRKHMKKMHPSELGDMARCDASKCVKNALASKRKSVATFLSPTKRTKMVKPAEEEMATRLFIEWLAKRLRPLTIAEDIELRFFITFIQTIDGIYELPSRRTITERLQGYAEQMRSQLKENLEDAFRFYSLTTDIWTSRVTESFISLTIHFVSDEFEYSSYTLEVSPFPGIHTGSKIAGKVGKMMHEWGLDVARVAKFVRDNGSNIVKACNDLGVEYFGCVAHSLHLGALAKFRKDVGEVNDENINSDDIAELEEGDEEWVEDIDAELDAIASLESELDGVRVPNAGEVHRSVDLAAESMVNLEADDALDEGLLDGCLSLTAASRLTNAMKSAMATARDHVASFRKIVHYFRTSAKGKALLKALQKDTVALTVINDVATRWNSTHPMIRRLLVLRPTLLKFLEYITTSRGKEDFSDVNLVRPTGEMWFTIECLDKLLVGFDGMTTVLSGDSYPTITLVLPCLRLLEKRLKNKHMFKKAARTHKRFQNLPMDVKYCCLLDPQFTTSEIFSPAEQEEGKLFLEEEAMRLAGVHVVPAQHNTSIHEDSDDEEDFVSELFGRKTRSSKPDTTSADLSLREHVKAEVVVYFEKCKLYGKTKSVSKTQSENNNLSRGLKWWKDNAGDFPFLAPVARKYFGIVATSVSSERCFSRTGNAITAQRNRLTGTNVRDILLLHSNSVQDDFNEEENDDDVVL